MSRGVVVVLVSGVAAVEVVVGRGLVVVDPGWLRSAVTFWVGVLPQAAGLAASAVAKSRVCLQPHGRARR